MLAISNETRLEQEISNIIAFICEAREYFFKLTGYTLNSSDRFINFWETIDLFQSDKKLIQLDLNIQLLFVKLYSYYELVSNEEKEKVKIPRLAFAHALTPLIFHGKINYNFFLYKVSENFKRIAFLFYTENPDNDNPENNVAHVQEINLDETIQSFLKIWSHDKKL